MPPSGPRVSYPPLCSHVGIIAFSIFMFVGSDSATIKRMADDIAEMKLQRLVPSGNHVTFSVFYKELLNYGVIELNADVPSYGDAVAEPEAYSTHTDEGKLVAAMTPLLQSVLSGGNPNLILSNTEEIKWIEAGGDDNNRQKCDLVLLLDGLQVPHGPTGSAEVKAYRELEKKQSEFNYKFGAPSYQIRDFISGIIEFKANGLDSTAKGELASYLKHLSADDDPNTYVGLLCDRKDYVVSSCKRGNLADFELGKWSDPGSAIFLKKKFARKNKWLQLLLGLCDQLQVCLCPEPDKSAFLGRGGYGVVFRVKSLVSGDVFALKSVLYSQNATTPSSVIMQMLPEEHSKLQALRGASCVSVVEGGLTTVLDNRGNELGAGYLMEDVGQNIIVSECFDVRGLTALGSAVFMALQSLHERNYAHGDARIANVLRFGETVKWVDTMLSVSVPQTIKRGADIKKLLESLLPTNSAAVAGLMKSTTVTIYCKDCSVQNMNQVCDAVSVASLSSSGSMAHLSR